MRRLLFIAPALILILAPGGFLTLGLVMGGINHYKERKRHRRRATRRDRVDADAEAEQLRHRPPAPAAPCPAA